MWNCRHRFSLRKALLLYMYMYMHIYMHMCARAHIPGSSYTSLYLH